MLIPRKKKGGHGGGPDANAWMMSYADMATILLAMFIVLSTFAQDQSGISLYYGTGSFRAAVTSFGLPGLTSNSSQVVPLKAPGPQHTLPSQGADAAGPSPHNARDLERGSGSSGSASPRIIDAEEENFQNFLKDMDRNFPTAKQPRSGRQTSLDFFDKPEKAPPYLTDSQREQIAPLLALVRRSNNYRMQLIIWAGTPRDTAIARSANQAADIVADLAANAGLDADARKRFIAVGQSWPYSDVQRPAMSVVVTRTD